MDAPPVQYVTTSDGYDIAYSVSGEGTPFVFMPFSWNHVSLTWQRLPEIFEGLNSRFQLVHYDGRGQGMSSRGLSPATSIKDYERDLEAVIERSGLARFILLGYDITSGHVAVRYSVRNPERVLGLILLASCSSSEAWPLAGPLGLGRQNWDVFLRSWLPVGTSPEDAERFFKFVNQATTPSDSLTHISAFASSDVSELLPRLLVPTLVLHPRDFAWLAPSEAAKVAALAPGARLVLLSGSGPTGDSSEFLRAIDGFAKELAAQSGHPATEKSLAVQLSARELDVLRLIATGKSNAQIAEDLVISQNTVIRHVSNIFAKIGAANRAEAASYATRHGIA